MVLMHLVKYEESLAWAGRDLEESECFHFVCMCVCFYETKKKIGREEEKREWNKFIDKPSDGCLVILIPDITAFTSVV